MTYRLLIPRLCLNPVTGGEKLLEFASRQQSGFISKRTEVRNALHLLKGKEAPAPCAGHRKQYSCREVSVTNEGQISET